MKQNHKNVLVTGAAGYVGIELCKRLRTEGYHVTALLRQEKKGPWDRCVVADLLKNPLPTNCMENIDVVIHLAAKAPAGSQIQGQEYIDVNVGGTKSLLDEAAKGTIKNFILFSTVLVYPVGGKNLSEEIIPEPDNVYGKSKYEAEGLLLAEKRIARRNIIRPSMVYGDDHIPGNLPRMVQSIINGKFPPWPKTNNQRSMVHINDLIDVTISLLNHSSVNEEIFNISDDHAYSTRKIYNLVLQSLGRKSEKWVVPMWGLRVLAKVGDLIGIIRKRPFSFNSDILDKMESSLSVSSEKAKMFLNFKPKHDFSSALINILK